MRNSPATPLRIPSKFNWSSDLRRPQFFAPGPTLTAGQLKSLPVVIPLPLPSPDLQTCSVCDNVLTAVQTVARHTIERQTLGIVRETLGIIRETLGIIRETLGIVGETLRVSGATDVLRESTFSYFCLVHNETEL